MKRPNRNKPKSIVPNRIKKQKQNIGVGNWKKPKLKTTQNTRQHEQLKKKKGRRRELLMKMDE